MTATGTITHVLMTRFNMATPGKEAAIRTQPDWLAGRFALFEKYCLPSVAAQTTRDFTWIIYFDKDTPQEFKDRIARLQEVYPFHAYYTGLFPAEGWPRSLVEVLGALPPFVLTSRLDNDDALACDYMERTMAAAQAALPGIGAQGRVGIVLANGFIRSETGAYRIHHPSNAFISWLEHTDDVARLMTAMGILHMDAAQHGTLVQVGGPGGWLQVVHGGNVSNRVRGARTAPEALQGRFPPGALDGLAKAGALEIGFENAVLTPLRGGRDALVNVLRQLRRRLR